MRQIARERRNTRYLPEVSLPDAIMPTADLAEALAGVREVVVAVPSEAFAAVVAAIAETAPAPRVLWATKGLEPKTGQWLHEIAAETFAADTPLAVLSGPSFAREVGLGMPTAVTVASVDADFAAWTVDAFHCERFRVYTSSDVIGVEIGGAAKNVIAIAAGIADGLNFGFNARAALITRGLAEIMRLGTALGAQPETLMGLTGLGDLVLTCTGDLSRNRRFGLALAAGHSRAEALAAIGQAVEGIGAARAIHALAAAHAIEMPISEQVFHVLHEDLAPKTAVEMLLSRTPKSEFE